MCAERQVHTVLRQRQLDKKKMQVYTLLGEMVDIIGSNTDSIEIIKIMQSCYYYYVTVTSYL